MTEAALKSAPAPNSRLTMDRLTTRQVSYSALIGDIVESRRITNRAQVQRALQRTLDRLNDTLGSSMASGLVITGGDELQGLFMDPSSVPEVLTELADRLAPVRLVYGLGRGSLTTDLRPEAVGMDGPCFHRAREAVQQAKKEDRWLVAKGFPGAADRQVRALFALMGALRSTWTYKQTVYVAAARRCKSQKEVAEEFRVSPSVVSESLSAAHFRELLEGEQAARVLLCEFSQKQVSQ
jgi:hypothetical protein